MKKIILLGLFIIQALFLASTSGFALCYSSKTNGEEIHQMSCRVALQATGSLNVYFDDGSGGCGTATLIAPDVLLTAAHVLVSPGKEIKHICFQPQASPSPITPNIIQKPKNIWIHPDYNHTSKIKNHDIAIIQLAQPFNPDHIRPAQLQKTLPDDFVFADTTVVGYGSSGNNNEGAIFNDRKRRAGNMELFLDRNEKNCLYMPFTPNTNEIGFIDSADSSKYTTIAAPGDSGGPAFIQIKGEPSPRILAITQGYEQKHDLISGITSTNDKFMSIPYYYPWIESKLRLCNRSKNIGKNLPTLDYNKSYNFSQYANNQAEISWNEVKEALSTTSQQGSEVLQLLYNHALSSDKQSFQDTLSNASQKGVEMLHDYIAIHKELFL